MPPTLISTTRQAPKHDGITDKLRSAIARGKLKPGDRLPVRTELESQLKASRMTVQKALDELIRDGFVISK
ncbi:MAG: winged helix-turn-helix domain-containing protein, partial [Phycisphaeraceae bacterium JB051]